MGASKSASAVRCVRVVCVTIPLALRPVCYAASVLEDPGTSQSTIVKFVVLVFSGIFPLDALWLGLCLLCPFAGKERVQGVRRAHA